MANRQTSRAKTRRATTLRARKPVRKAAVTKAATKTATKTAAKTARDDPQDVVEAALAVFAHEVRTPLTGILAVAGLLATSELGERERRWVDTIRSSADHLSALATLFVDAARSRTRKVAARREFFDPRSLTRTVADSLAARAVARGLTARIEMSDRIPAFAIGDAVRLRAALENLVDNAVKFTASGSVGFAVAPFRSGKKRFGLRFRVSDSGIGLTAAEAKRLFRPFSQANMSIVQRFGGAGLGLASARQLARAMGGDVTVAPRRGGGSVFTMTVMLDAADSSGETESARKIAGGDRPLRILSVEDNPFGRVVLDTILRELGHEPEFVGLGEGAGAKLAESAFDVVLMDMVLPGIGGVESIKRIRALGAPHGDVAIVGLSGRDEDEAGARAAGADAFILKPVSPRILAETLSQAVRARVARAASSS
jgi:signal transduction histidine kinase